jgi:hypothetical protein
VRERFEGLAARLEMERHSLVWEGESAEALVAEMAAGTPPMAAAKEALPPERYDDLMSEQVELVRRWGGDGPLRIETDYIVTVARKRG